MNAEEKSELVMLREVAMAAHKTKQSMATTVRNSMKDDVKAFWMKENDCDIEEAIALGVSVSGYPATPADVCKWMLELVSIPHAAVVPLCLVLGIDPNELYGYHKDVRIKWQNDLREFRADQERP